MESALAALSAGESKGRAEAFQNLADGLRAGKIALKEDLFGDLMRKVVDGMKDHNVKLSANACDTLCALCDVLPDPNVLEEYSGLYSEPLCDLLGSAKAGSRERAFDTCLSLMTNTNPHIIMANLLTKGAKHKNWRVREGVLSLYAAQVLAYKGGSYCNEPDMLKFAVDSLSDAQPEVRKAATEALATLAMQVGLPKTLAKAGEKGARAAQLGAVRERHAVLTGGAPADTFPVSETEKQTNSKGKPASPVERPAERPPAVSSGKLPSPVERVPAAGAGQRPAPLRPATADERSIRTPAASLSTPVAESRAFATDLYCVEFEEAASDPVVMSLCGLHTSTLWRPGVIGFDGEAGKVQPVPVSTLKDLSKVLEGVCGLCNTITADWSARSKALDRLRGVLIGGAVSCEGFAACILKLKEPLCAQVQELRSSLVKQACLAAAELSAYTCATGWMEPLAEPLVEICLRLTAVSISVISSSAHACIRTILHNTRSGFHRVIPKICAGCRSKSAITRAHASSYLLQILRGWSRACIERHADEVASTVIGLIKDADKDARSAGRFAYWSLAALLPMKAEMVLSTLDGKLQRTVVSDEALEATQADTIAVFCEPLQLVPDMPTSPASTPIMPNPVPQQQQRPPVDSMRPTTAPTRVQPQIPQSSFPAAAPGMRAEAFSVQPPIASGTGSLGPSTAALIRAPPSPADIPPPIVEAVIVEPHLTRYLERVNSLIKSSDGAVHGAGHSHPLRDAIMSVFSILVNARAIDARSVARIYADRLPPALSEHDTGGVIPAEVQAEYGTPSPATQPILCDDYLSASSVLALCRHLVGETDRPTKTSQAGVITSLLPEAIRACLTNSHENVQLDGLALAFAVVDACVGIDSDVADSVSELELACAEVETDQSNVRLFTVKLAAANVAGDVVATAVPVFARCFMRGGKPFAGEPYSTHFMDIFHLIIAHSTSSSDQHRAMARRVIAALRRAYSASLLLQCTLNVIHRPVSLSTGEGSDGLGGGSSTALRTHAACIMLALSLLGDASAAATLLARISLLQRLLDSAARLLAPAVSAQVRIQAYIEQIVSLLWKSDPDIVTKAVRALTDDKVGLLCQFCDADAGYGGTIVGFSKAVRPPPVPVERPRTIHAPPVAPVSSYISAYTAESSQPSMRPAIHPSAVVSMPARVVSAIPPAAPSSVVYGSVSGPPSGLSTGDGKEMEEPGVLTLSRGNLELIREALVSTEMDRVTRALHFLGRSVDNTPPAAAIQSNKPLSTASPMVPAVHRHDAVYLALLERVVAGVLDTVRSSSLATLSDASTQTVDTSMLQTALSVLRKMFRNVPAYLTTSSGAVLAALLSAYRHATREIITVLDRTVDECMERMPAELVLSHFVSNVIESDGDTISTAIAALKALARFVPRLPAVLVLAELNKGRLMECLATHFLSTSTDVRRAVVQLLVNLHLLVGPHFSRFAEAYLSVPQQKLLAIYIEKEQSSRPM